MGSLTGKAVVVTGAGRGLGKAYARLAAAEGAKIVVNDVDRDCAERVVGEILDEGGKAIASDADISDWAMGLGLINSCLDAFGRLDGLINNAALFYMARPDEETSNSMDELVRVNFLGTAYCGIHALRVMQAQNSGSILNVTSGAHAGFPEMAMYGATKGAIASLTYGWASDVAGTGVRVNAISPIARTRMYDKMLERGDTRSSQTGLDIEPEENAAVAVFLLSDDARDINGQIVRVDIPRLTIMTHPSEVSPAAKRENWTVADVRDAFRERLGDQVQPLGLPPANAAQ